jgi:hypothetical protein
LRASGGDVDVQRFASPLGAIDQQHDVSSLNQRIPSLSATALGPGRNKLFVRGIADSSFSGHSQATLGEYLGEARINYDAPDPGLLLYDVKQVELLKGPQGTLYGGGTLAGVLRIEPMRPDLARSAAFLDLSGSGLACGDPGYAAAGMVNLPVRSEVAGIRLLSSMTRAVRSSSRSVVSAFRMSVQNSTSRVRMT